MDSKEKIILIVDDELHIKQSFSYFFEDREWQVFTADSGEAALELLKTMTCSVAIVDIRMRGMDGESFIRIASERYPSMFFVVCTGSPMYEISEDLIQLPCVVDKVFGKPVMDMNGLEETILRLIEGCI
ncbi:MAG: response regulator [Desulfobacteraceae bacterium]